MKNQQLVDLALEYCKFYHDGQFRKGGNQPYHTHPIAVAKILEKFGYHDSVPQCIALLHDVVEDSEVITGEIRERFGFEISNGVYVLSKNTIKEPAIDLVQRVLGSVMPTDKLYKIRLSFARETVQRIKIADMIHNTQDLITLKPEGRQRKIDDAEQFYIPLGKVVAPLMVRELEQNLDNYRRLIASGRQ
ncbi:MAG TPA: HD domain-containing protein [Candidatus Nanoarchaeia archaeon]|nr:HD domain-containing protein [Candidatus Nanoarchaeia archaeon]